MSRARESESIREDHQRSFAGAGVRRFREAEPSSRPISGLGRPIPVEPAIRSIPSLRSLAAHQPAQASRTLARPLLRTLSVWLHNTEMVIYRALATSCSCSMDHAHTATFTFGRHEAMAAAATKMPACSLTTLGSSRHLKTPKGLALRHLMHSRWLQTTDHR